jgi:DNA modification methylase
MSKLIKATHSSTTYQPANGPLQVKYRPITDLKPNSKNARVHTRQQIRQIARSINAFGCIVPLLIDDEESIIAGHGRYAACQQLGFTEVPTICIDHLNDDQKRAFMIADNRLTENSRWDDKLLAEQLRELSLHDLDFDLEVTGFDIAEIDLRIEGLNENPGEETDPADNIPPLNSASTICQAGDLWVLGRHRMLCSNSLDPLAYLELFARNRATLVFTDPPYNVPINGHATGNGKIRHREFAMACGEMDEAAFKNFMATALGLAARYSKNGAIHFVCMDWRHIGEVLAASRPIYSELKNICVWVKHNAGMGSFYRSQHEFVFVFKCGSGRHRNNVELGRFGRHRSNVWTYRGANSLGLETEEGNLLALHPTVKPVAMVADAILDCSARGDIVLDPFLGSGTTLLAAERTGRHCCGIEIDPTYADVVIRRWQAFTGENAKHAATGKSFTDTARERSPQHG